MLKQVKPRYNEPLPQPKGDVVPKLKSVRTATLGPRVAIRLDLEKNLRLCGLAKPGKSIRVSSVMRGLLLVMLHEVDSPLSASLRARVAHAAGPLKLAEAASTLRNLALDEAEDLSTRLGAVRSYLHLGGRRADKELPKLLASKTWQVRAVAYVQALRSGYAARKAYAEKAFQREKPGRVKEFVGRRLPGLAGYSATTKDK
jgi:hypothetical protein